MITDLLLKLEEEKDDWICEALRRLDDVGNITKKQSPEQHIIFIKTTQDQLLKQKSLDIESMESELKMLDENWNNDEKLLKDLETNLAHLQGELHDYDNVLTSLEQIMLEAFEWSLDEYFTYDDKKKQVIFKERKTSKLKEIFKLEQTKMQESYELQMSKYLGKIQQIFQTLELVDSLEVHTNPPFVRLSLKHGHGLDQYVNLANFKEDYFVLFEVLGKNNQIASHYYLRQLNEFKKKGRKELLKLVSEKGKQIRLQEDKINQIMKQQLEKESRRKVLEKQVTSAWWEWNHLMEQLLMIKDILKEEFVKALSRWQDKMFSEEESPEERWIYHQYGQRMMKQAERIIGK